MKRLHELLRTQRDEVIQLWVSIVRGSLHPESMPHVELVDHIPVFLDEIAFALLRNSSPESSATAAEHGEQRLALGFSLDAVVREYGVLREAILEVAKTHDVSITAHEHEVLSRCFITGIAEAVSEFTRQRDAEIQRQSTEHFAFIAHEIRNPLNSAMLALEVLRSRGVLPEKDRTVAVLHRGLTQVQELVEHSLRAARVGSGIELRKTRVELAHLLEEAVNAVGIDSEFKGIQIHVRADVAMQIDVDVRLIASALSNLIRNAVKFTHSGGAIFVRGTLHGGVITIEVEDGCGGLEPGVVEAAFAPFVQLGADRSGFGLGLSIAKQAVDAHGGALRVQNLPGKGCIFVLELPVHS